ncbi:hypothetical protein D3C75_906520 [compost metagenome]
MADNIRAVRTLGSQHRGQYSLDEHHHGVHQGSFPPPVTAASRERLQGAILALMPPDPSPVPSLSAVHPDLPSNQWMLESLDDGQNDSGGYHY